MYVRSDFQLRKDKEMRDFFIDCQAQGKIDPRDSLFGGRTMAFKLFERADDDYEISMFDIVSAIQIFKSIFKHFRLAYILGVILPDHIL